MEKENNKQVKWYETMTVKMFLLGTMAILFLIPLQLIKMVIKERESNSFDVKMEISEQWGKKQTVIGPVLNIPVFRTRTDNNIIRAPEQRVWHILPDKLDISGFIEPEIRYKGIYETVIYTASLNISGSFTVPEREMENYTIAWGEAYMTMGISDNRGLVNSIIMTLDNSEISAEPGLIDHDLFDSGLSFPLGVNPGKKEMVFSLQFDMKGSDGIYFTPVGKITTVELKSSWDSPSFNGKYIPFHREIDENGFIANWEVTHLNRNFPQEWVGTMHNISEESFGSELILGVDHYQKSERSAKYGLLFIAFTFLVLVFVEVSSDKRVHIFSYFLVSMALVLFFSLLNALSEHIGFNPAYLVASVSTIALISGFSGALLKDRKKILLIGGLLIILYAFLYFLLSLNEYAYLAGNIGLFIGLAAIMWLTTKTDLFRRNGL